jgi:hypothetical protein
MRSSLSSGLIFSPSNIKLVPNLPQFLGKRKMSTVDWEPAEWSPTKICSSIHWYASLLYIKTFSPPPTQYVSVYVLSSLNWPSLWWRTNDESIFLTCIYSIEKNHFKSKHSNALHLFFLDVCFRNAKLIATRFSRFRINRHAATRRHRLSWTLTCIQQKCLYWTSVFWYYLLTWHSQCSCSQSVKCRRL